MFVFVLAISDINSENEQVESLRVLACVCPCTDSCESFSVLLEQTFGDFRLVQSAHSFEFSKFLTVRFAQSSDGNFCEYCLHRASRFV